MTVQKFHNILYRSAVHIHHKRFFYKRSHKLVKLIVLVLVYLKTDRNKSAVVLTFQSILRYTTDYFFGQLRRVVFRISFQNGFKDNSLRAL